MTISASAKVNWYYSSIPMKSAPVRWVPRKSDYPTRRFSTNSKSTYVLSDCRIHFAAPTSDGGIAVSSTGLAWTTLACTGETNSPSPCFSANCRACFGQQYCHQSLPSETPVELSSARNAARVVHPRTWQAPVPHSRFACFSCGVMGRILLCTLITYCFSGSETAVLIFFLPDSAWLATEPNMSPMTCFRPALRQYRTDALPINPWPGACT